MGNVLLALEALQGLLVLVQEGTTAAQRIRDLLDTAQREGRDITDEELDQVQAARHDIEKSLLDKLGEARCVEVHHESKPGGALDRKVTGGGASEHIRRDDAGLA